MSLSLTERIDEIYQKFSAGHLDELAEMFDEDVSFVSNAPLDVFPYLGRRIGRAEVAKALESVHEEFSSISYIPLKIILEDQSAGVILSMRLTQRGTGRFVRLFAAHFLRFKDDRISEYRAFLDSFEAVQQVLGRELDVK